MDNVTKALELLDDLCIKNNIPITKKKQNNNLSINNDIDFEKKAILNPEEYIHGFVKHKDGSYLGGLECEGGQYFIEDYKRATYYSILKNFDFKQLIPNYMIEYENINLDDLTFVEAEIIFK